MFQPLRIAIDGILQCLLAFTARQAQRVGKRLAVQDELTLLAQGENQHHRAAEDGGQDKRPLWERCRLAHESAPDHAPFAAALRIHRDAIPHNRDPFTALKLLFDGNGGVRADVGDRHQIHASFGRHFAHDLLKALGVLAENQGVDDFTAFQLSQGPAGLYVAKVRGQQQFALWSRDV